MSGRSKILGVHVVYLFSLFLSLEEEMKAEMLSWGRPAVTGLFMETLTALTTTQ